ncbi:electron transfer flavoprotein subunit beta/FixA family protein [Photobacterium aphoticum]|uniref:Electron transfer flavoprotein alpha/beta-subunit N-terminal domain-containing protein n=1 Tax=Photobacterium aphoticum TaxID=754436 RepID=A0A0J1GQQ7_9GAMM|nr:electron transfer flavoprotein subunit beta/FixA family protein [Photobacterium aphoticum]KLV01749.1 hypothetical protein ABT58_04755 [Photobacterium aphoticum]PSU58772.1 electron transfer flavoprotein subunit beta/FixA family protein [Photobacterium aphoticum]GHA32081.1 electron transfer flavoprotein subunit beta [Photobacterium aphoticum]
MKIAVCVKQVPVAAASLMGDTSRGGKSLQRVGIDSMLNPFDAAALEAALQLKALYSPQGHELVQAHTQKQWHEQVEIDVFTMGPSQAGAVLSQAFALGVDNGYLVTSPHFAGADVLATAYTLSQALAMQHYDVVICGKQSTDGDTGQVGPSLAAHLGIPHVHHVDRLLNASATHLQLCQRTPLIEQSLSVPFPLLLVVNMAAFPCRVPSLKQKLAARKKTWHSIGLEALADQDPARYGLAGSATEVERVYVPRQRDHACETLTGTNAAIAQQVLDVMQEVVCDA